MNKNWKRNWLDYEATKATLPFCFTEKSRNRMVSCSNVGGIK